MARADLVYREPVLRRKHDSVGSRLVRHSPRRTRRDHDRVETLKAYGDLLGPVSPVHLVVVGGSVAQVGELAMAFSGALPDSRITGIVAGVRKATRSEGPGPRVEIVSCPSLDEIHLALLERGTVDLVVDDGGVSESLRHKLFSQFFLGLAEGGRWLIRDGDEAHEGDDDGGETLPRFISRLFALGQQGGVGTAGLMVHPDDRFRAEAVEGPFRRNGVLAVRKRGRHVAKLRDEESDRALPRRLGSRWGSVLEQRPSREVSSSASLEQLSPPAEDRLVRHWHLPTRTLRVHHDVVCLPRQLVLAEDVVLPASYHHPQRRRLRHPGLIDSARWYAQLRHSETEAAPLPGTWYHLASEFPGHFGHVMTEDLSRLWGFAEARRRYPDLKLLVGAGDPGPPDFLLDLVEGYGVDRHDIFASPVPVRVERLVTATPQLHNGAYVDPDIVSTWNRVCSGLVQESRGPERLFITRPADVQRRCLNATAVEEVFSAADFSLVRPEMMTMAEQLTMFAGAKVVAGYAGSGMFSALAMRPGSTVIVIASETYIATNEWLISSVKGFHHHQIWCPSTQPPSRTFNRSSFHADFSFDFDQAGDDLHRLLRALD